MAYIMISRIARSLHWLVTGTPAQRRRVRQEMARISARLFGDFPLSEDYKSWREDKQFQLDYQRLSPGNPYSQDRKWTVREFVKLSNILSGDMAECGCYQGATAFFMAQASTSGALYLFDSFQGISSPGIRDQNDRSDVMTWAKGDLSSSEDVLRANLASFGSISVLPGWIPERFNEIEARRFRVVHIDVDLYRPTRDSLEFFYPRMVKGGIIIMDDYGFMTCPGAKMAADEFVSSVGAKILHLPTGQGVIFKEMG